MYVVNVRECQGGKMNVLLKRLLGQVLFCITAINLTFNIFSTSSQAAQQYQGLCARVKIEILQELTLERVGFLATLEITNNEGDAPITNFSAHLTFENTLLSSEISLNDASGLFFVRQPELTGINTIDGEGIIPPGQTAIIEWFIIPTIEAGGETPSGLEYDIGADLAGAIYGQEIAPNVLEVIPDTIVVKPEPQLDITYFQPRDVQGDDPFTPETVESPVPFIVGVLVRNVGYGTARNVMIESQQPRIVENKEGLLLIARLLGARVDDEPLDEASLTVNLGDINPMQCRKGAWDMITSLSGEFIEFKASYTHASELGGETTSVITGMNACFIAHEVKNDQAGRDNLLDFLADTDNDDAQLPDTLYESDCNVLPVNTLHSVSAIANGLNATITAFADREGWVYMRLSDPAQAKFPVASVVRSDGKRLNPHNYWTDIRYQKITNEKLPRLHVFDLLETGNYQYAVTYEQTLEDTAPPVTTLRFSGAFQTINNIYYILPDTQIYFTVDDDSPSSTYYRLNDASFLPAYPFSIDRYGTHQLSYYSEDASNHTESTQSVQIVVSESSQQIESFVITNHEMISASDAISLVPSQIDFRIQPKESIIPMSMTLEIFKGQVDQISGFDCSHLEKVKHVYWHDIDNSTIEYQWDGKNDEGRELSSGYYTVLITMTNDLGQQSYAMDTIYLGQLTGKITLTDSADTIQTNLSVSNGWAVWQDQRHQNWDIFACNLGQDGCQSITITTGILNQERPDTDGKIIVWEDFQSDGVRDIQMIVLPDRNTKINITQTTKRDEAKPSVSWPWIIYQTKDLNRSGASWQLAAYNITDKTETMIDPTQTDQLDPCIHNGCLVWQDFRNPGYGDIYFKNLLTHQIIAITDDAESQYHPVIGDQWVAWEDRRHGQKELYAYHIHQNQPIRLTQTSFDENTPSINGEWLVATDNSVGTLMNNVILIHLPSRALIRLTHSTSQKFRPYRTGNTIIWEDDIDSGYNQIYQAQLPVFQPVYPNQNAVLITQNIAETLKNAWQLLSLWHQQAGVVEIQYFLSMLPSRETQTAVWVNGQASGDNFSLHPNTYVWVKFDQSFVLNLGNDICEPVTLNPGPNVMSYGCFPDEYSSYQMIKQLGKSTVNAVRMLNAATGQWEVTIVDNEKIRGTDFHIPAAAVLLIDMNNQVIFNDR